MQQRPLRPAAKGGTGGAAAAADLLCAKCMRPVVGEYVEANGRMYHKECWICTDCKRPIAGKYFAEDNGAFLCSSCKESHAPKCPVCRRPIMGRYVTVNGSCLHPECFTCGSCQKRIEGQYFVDEGTASQGPARGAGNVVSFLCPRCNEKLHPPEICGGCHKPIRSGKTVTANGRHFHADCFTCSKCRRIITGSFVNVEDSHLCQSCQPSCSVCGSGLAGHRTVQVGSEKIHAKCFRCCDCNTCLEGKHYEVPEKNPFKASKAKHRCAKCHANAWQAAEDSKSKRAEVEEDRRNLCNEREFKLRWRPDLVPCSRKALQDLGLRIMNSHAGFCVCYNEASGHVGCAPVNDSYAGAAVNVAYLACVLRVLRKDRHEPIFSLDPKDPHNLGGPNLVKRFHPEWLAGTVVGEVLFQADYALKQICFGDKTYAPLGLPSAFDASSPVGEERASRQWFTVKRASISVAADGALVPHVELSVETRRLTRCSTGYKDAAYTDPHDPMVRQAAAVSERFAEIAARVPVAAELISLARATVLAMYLLRRGCCPDDAVLERYSMPRLPEGSGIMEIPTLTKDRRNSLVSEKDGGLVLTSQSRCMRGGVDLTVPVKEVTTKPLAKKVMDPRARPALLPLFLPPQNSAFAACAA